MEPWVPALRRTAKRRYTASRTRELPAHLGDEGVRNLEIGVDVLHVVMLVQLVDQLQQPLAGFVVDRNRVLRLPGQRRLAGFAEFRLQRLGDLAKGFLRG